MKAVTLATVVPTMTIISPVHCAHFGDAASNPSQGVTANIAAKSISATFVDPSSPNVLTTLGYISNWYTSRTGPTRVMHRPMSRAENENPP